jgi:hypothetical protein
MKKRYFPDDPVRERKFLAILALTRRHMQYRRILWARLRKLAPTTKRRDLGSDWATQYVKAMARATKHEKRMEAHSALVMDWIVTAPSVERKRAMIRIATIDGRTV